MGSSFEDSGRMFFFVRGILAETMVTIVTFCLGKKARCLLKEALISFNMRSIEKYKGYVKTVALIIIH